MKYTVKEIRLGFAVEFIYENMTDEDKIDMDMRANYFACYNDNELIGVISYNDTAHARRIKAVLVKKEYELSEVYKLLINKCCDTNKKKITVFAPEKVYKQYEINGFEVERISRYGIRFMEYKEEKENGK